MKYGELSVEEWEQNAQEFKQIKELLIRWMKPIPASEFSMVDDALWPEDAPAYRYSDRFRKTCFIRALRDLSHLSTLQELLGYLNRHEDVIAMFLCSKLSLKNWQTTRTLIDYLDCDDESIEHFEMNYSEILDKGFYRLGISYHGDIFPLTFDKVPPQKRFEQPECRSAMCGTFMECQS